MNKVIAIVLSLALPAIAVDVAYHMSDLTWTGTGLDRVATWQVGQQDVLNGLVAWWKFDEAFYDGTDGEIADSSGKGNVGTTHLTVSSAAGKISNAASFGVPDGANGYASFLKNNLQVTTNVSVSVWFNSYRKSFSGYIFIWGFPDAEIDRILSVRLDNGILLCEIGTYARYQYFYQTGTTDYTDSAWHHVLLVYDGVTCKLYVDGVLNSEINITGGLNMSGDYTESLLVGGTGTYFFHGLIDDVRIYGRALSSNEMATIYNRYK